MWPFAGGARLGKYRLLRRLAVGGMAEIFLARSKGISGFEKLVVVKRILPEHAQDEQLTRMFLDEARLMASLDHPNLTQVYDVGQARGSYYFAMEYVHGQDVRSILEASLGAGHPVPAEHAIGIIMGAAAGLHYAHEKAGPDGQPLAIVHRDVSPSNVLVSYDGGVKVADFGVAKWAAQQSKTVHGTLKGKFQYMSPEQCRGEPLDRRSDVFALGILLYELTTGTRLYQGASDYAILHQIVNNDPTPPSARHPGYPPELERIVMKALARDPRARFATAEALQVALEEVAREKKLVVSPVARARYMEELFGGRIAGAEAGGRVGAATVQTQVEEGARVSSVRAVLSVFSRTSGSRVARRRTQAVLFGAAAVVALVFGLATWAAKRPAPVVEPAPLTLPSPRERGEGKIAPIVEPAPVVQASPVPPEEKSPRARKRHKTIQRKAVAPREGGKKAWDPDSVFLPK